MTDWITVETPPGYYHTVKRINRAFIVHVSEADEYNDPQEGVCYIRDAQGFVSLYRGTINELTGQNE